MISHGLNHTDPPSILFYFIDLSVTDVHAQWQLTNREGMGEGSSQYIVFPPVELQNDEFSEEHRFFGLNIKLF